MHNRSRWIAVCILAVGFMASAAHADVIYSFSGVENGLSVGFQLSTSSYLNGLAVLSPSDMNSCTNCGGFITAVVLTPTITFLDSYGGIGTFLFSFGAFSTPGTYSTSWLSPNKGTLVVSVPEPATLLLGFLSLVTILGFVAFKRNPQMQLNRC
jgi:hypothetical protein